MLRRVEWQTVADVSKNSVSSSLGSSGLTVFMLLSLGAPWPRRHEDPLKLRGNHTPKYTISHLWRQIFSNTAISTLHITHLGLRNRHSPELGTNTEKYGSSFTQPPCIQTVNGTNLDRNTNCRDRILLIFSVISLTNYPITRRYMTRSTGKVKLTTIPNSNRVPLIVRHNLYKACRSN
jgi:hypothetical protein